MLSIENVNSEWVCNSHTHTRTLMPVFGQWFSPTHTHTDTQELGSERKRGNS